MSDPLSLVRLATQKGLQVLERNDEYHFGTRSYGIKTETCFRRTLSSAKTQYYTLKDVIFFIQNSTVDIKEYRRAVIKERCVAVVEADKAPLMSYLQGEVDSVSQMDPEKAAEVVATADKKGTSKESSSAKGAADKKSRGEDMARDDAVMDVDAPRPVDNAADQERAESKKRMLYFDKDGNDMRVGTDGFRLPGQQDVKRSKVELTASRRGESSVADRASVLRSNKVNFAFALKSFNNHVLKKLDEKHKAAEKPGKSSSKSSSKGVLPAMNRVLKPIIIVPSAMSGVINSTNAKEMLGDSRYVSLEEAKERGLERQTAQTVVRKLPGSNHTLEYKVIDNPNKLAEEDWGAVVAIFATGQLWQFKGWKWEDPRPLFANILGVHLNLDDVTLSENILQWNCKVLKINRTKRHSDAIAMNKFWGYVDGFVALHRPEMHAMVEKQLATKI